MLKSVESRLVLAFLLLIAIDVVNEIIKSNLNVTLILSKVILRGSTLLVAWIFIKFIK